MRATLFIFALIGLAAISLLVLIGTGLLHLSSLDALATRTGFDPAATQLTTEPDENEDPDPTTTDPASSSVATRAVLDRSVFLSARDASLTGPQIALLASDAIVLKTGDGNPPPPLPELPDFRRGGRFGGDRNGRRSRAPPPPFISHWRSPDDCVEWTFESPAAAVYMVSFVYAGPPGRADGGKEGGPFIMSAGDQQIVASLKHTTGFEMAAVGTLKLPRGTVRLTIRPQGKISDETSIRLRSVRLFPNEQ